MKYLGLTKYIQIQNTILTDRERFLKLKSYSWFGFLFITFTLYTLNIEDCFNYILPNILKAYRSGICDRQESL